MDVKINILNERTKTPVELIEACGKDELIAKIFYNRGYKDPKTVKIMLNDELYEPTLPSEFPGMERAVKRILKAIDSKELICIYGDYDVDGVTSTVTLVECLKNYTDFVIYHVPDRFTEGYGMNEQVIESLHKKGVSLIITCDCGISNVNEINLSNKLKMDVILTDHHNIPDETPNAYVILNPKLLEEGHRARNISGCAMAYFLCLALLEEKGDADIADKFLDLLAMSLIADVVSLNGENRYLLKKSLPPLISTERLGLSELFKIANKNGSIDDEEDIAFQIAPRINAAGRMDTARLPVQLFLCKKQDLAKEMAEKIDALNSERKRVQQKIIDEAIEIVETQKKNKTVLALYGEFWHHGIVGIAAGRICELYGKPAILLSIKDDGSTVVGSARSIEEVNMYELLKECSGGLLKFGGHSQAAGLSLKKENLEDFIKEIEMVAEKKHFIKDTIIANVDTELSFEEISEELLLRLQSAGPYGEGFRAPEFYSSNIRIVSDRKTEKNHHIMVVEDENNIRIPAVKWFGEAESLEGKVFDITYKVGVNTYKGKNTIQLTIGHMVENSSIKRVLFKGNIIDERKLPINTLLLKYKNTQIFYEGPKSMCPIDDTINRFNVKPKKDIVFLSPPTNTSIFREVIALADPKNIIINFTLPPDYSFKGFLINFLGIIKHIINNKEGREYIEVLSQKLCVEEGIIKAGFKYLRAKGMINYVLSDEHSKVFTFKGKREKNDKNIVFIEKSLKAALMEKDAYKEFILKMDKDKFKEYLR